MPFLFETRFVNSGGFIAHGIDWITNSLFDHVEHRSRRGNWIGAHWQDGVQERPANYLDKNLTREYRYGISLEPDIYNKMQDFAEQAIGAKYNKLDIFGLLFKHRELTSPHHYICSQFEIAVSDVGNLKALNVLPNFEYLITPETYHLSHIFRSDCGAQLIYKWEK